MDNFSNSFPCCLHMQVLHKQQTICLHTWYNLPDMNIHGGTWNSSYSNFSCIDITIRSNLIFLYKKMLDLLGGSFFYSLMLTLYRYHRILEQHLCLQGYYFYCWCLIHNSGLVYWILFPKCGIYLILFPKHDSIYFWFVCCPIPPNLMCFWWITQLDRQCLEQGSTCSCCRSRSGSFLDWFSGEFNWLQPWRWSFSWRRREEWLGIGGRWDCVVVLARESS